MKFIPHEYYDHEEVEGQKRKKRVKKKKFYIVPDKIDGIMNDFTVEKLPTKVGKEFITSYHYSKGIHNGPMTYGLFDAQHHLIGCCAFATPCSEAVRASVFGKDKKDCVTELHRLAIYPNNSPKGTATWFISRAINLLQTERPHLKAIISFSDMSQGHRGVIYRASNFLYCGTTGRAKFFRDDEGRLRHPRQCGINITDAMAKERGWIPEMRDSKHRYLLILGPAPVFKEQLGMGKKGWKRFVSKWKRSVREEMSPSFSAMIRDYPDDKEVSEWERTYVFDETWNEVTEGALI